MAYVPGRDISFNNRVLSHIVENVNNSESDNNVIVAFDAEKAFDSVSHDYLRAVLCKYNFPVKFINFFSLIYNNNSAVVQVNGNISKSFNIERGVKQGDALSCSLFVLAIDPLIRNIEANCSIKPLVLGGNNENCSIKTLAFADDIAVVTNQDSIGEIFKEYERLYHCSGLRLNADKTEILQLTRNYTQFNTMVSYLNEDIELLNTERIKICGNHLLLDPKERYNLNIGARIDSLQKILTNWTRRNLTIHGKMIIIKCHALSQLTFVNQFQNISIKDVKRIESICYKFLWNGGPDRVKRTTLKLSKLEGGIDGIDIESFLQATKIRQFVKADQFSKTVNFLQNYCLNEALTQSVRTYLPKLLRSCWKNVNVTDLTELDRSYLINCDLRYFCKPNCKILPLLCYPDRVTLNQVMNYGRTSVNKVIRFLPKIFKHLLHLNLPNIPNCPPIILGKKVRTIDKMSSRILQEFLKINLKKIAPYTINSKYELDAGVQHEQRNWFYLWKIRNPILRSYRLKVMYKDIYCQERRHKFGLSNSPSCLICNGIESVKHQLFECRNAQRMWYIYNVMFSEHISFKEVIFASSNLMKEIVKAVITKFLIQIDRSEHASQNQVTLRICQALKLELQVTGDKQFLRGINELEKLLI